MIPIGTIIAVAEGLADVISKLTPIIEAAQAKQQTHLTPEQDAQVRQHLAPVQGHIDAIPHPTGPSTLEGPWAGE